MPGAHLSRGLSSLPNKLTSLRLALAFVLFGLIHWRQWELSLAVFALAAFTDWLDGYLARRQNLMSSLGRVYDPLVDKVLVCGTFIFFLDVREAGLPGDTGWNAVMVAIVVAREFIVTGVRGLLEERDVTFGADLLGKAKMVLQCAAIVCVLICLSMVPRGSFPPGLVTLRDVLNLASVAVTFASGLNYVRRALEHLA